MKDYSQYQLRNPLDRFPETGWVKPATYGDQTDTPNPEVTLLGMRLKGLTHWVVLEDGFFLTLRALDFFFDHLIDNGLVLSEWSAVAATKRAMADWVEGDVNSDPVIVVAFSSVTDAVMFKMLL